MNKMLAMLFLLLCASCSKKPQQKIAKVVFWQSKADSDANNAKGIKTFLVNVAGEFAGSISVNDYWTSTPDCFDPSALIVRLNLGGEDTEPINYLITNQNGTELYKGVFFLHAEECRSFQLEP